jgi:hypothetical protein
LAAFACVFLVAVVAPDLLVAFGELFLTVFAAGFFVWRNAGQTSTATKAQTTKSFIKPP